MNDNSHEGKLARIEGRLDRPVANAIAVRSGSMTLNTMADVMEASKLMSMARQGVPKHLREEPGLCFSVIMQAISWEMDIFAVARQSFVINDFVSYGSQLIHAVIETRAPLRKRLRCTYSGDGGDRQCTVTGTFVGEDEPHTYTTPKLKDIPVKNSPLWKWDVDQQLFYLASRAWARKWCPDVLLGVYARDEAEFVGEHAAPVMDRIHNPLQDDADIVPSKQVEGAISEYTEKVLATGIMTPEEAEIKMEVMQPDGPTIGEVSVLPDGPLITTPATNEDGVTVRVPIPTMPRQARREPAGEPKPEPAPRQPESEKASPGPNPALAIALDQPWIKKSVADYILYLERWVEAWAKWGQDPLGLRDRFSAERTIRNGLAEKMTDKQLAQCKATAAGAFARLGGVPK